MALRKYIALFVGADPVLNKRDHDAKYQGHALAYCAGVITLTLIAHYNAPLGTAWKICLSILLLCALAGLLRSLYQLKMAVDG